MCFAEASSTCGSWFALLMLVQAQSSMQGNGVHQHTLFVCVLPTQLYCTALPCSCVLPTQADRVLLCTVITAGAGKKAVDAEDPEIAEANALRKSLGLAPLR
jgi:hypothetical protein